MKIRNVWEHAEEVTQEQTEGKMVCGGARQHFSKLEVKQLWVLITACVHPTLRTGLPLTGSLLGPENSTPLDEGGAAPQLLQAGWRVTCHPGVGLSLRRPAACRDSGCWAPGCSQESLTSWLGWSWGLGAPSPGSGGCGQGCVQVAHPGSELGR